MGDAGLQVHVLNRMANYFLVEAKGGLTLIDTGNRDSMDRIGNKFHDCGHDVSELARIIVTHSHHDHTANLSALKEASGAVVMAHEEEVDFIARREKPPRPPGPGGFLFHLVEPFLRPPAVETDVALKDGYALEGGFEIIHTPGHTPGSICVYHREARALFTGDAMTGMKGDLTGPISFFSSDIEEARRSLAKLAGLEIDTLYLAHGRVMRGMAPGAIRALCSRLGVKGPGMTRGE